VALHVSYLYVYVYYVHVYIYLLWGQLCGRAIPVSRALKQELTRRGRCDAAHSLNFGRCFGIPLVFDSFRPRGAYQKYVSLLANEMTRKETAFRWFHHWAPVFVPRFYVLKYVFMGKKCCVVYWLFLDCYLCLWTRLQGDIVTRYNVPDIVYL
jgi:hypothetical protein